MAKQHRDTISYRIPALFIFCPASALPHYQQPGLGQFSFRLEKVLPSSMF